MPPVLLQPTVPLRPSPSTAMPHDLPQTRISYAEARRQGLSHPPGSRVGRWGLRDVRRASSKQSAYCGNPSTHSSQYRRLVPSVLERKQTRSWARSRHQLAMCACLGPPLHRSNQGRRWLLSVDKLLPARLDSAICSTAGGCRQPRVTYLWRCYPGILMPLILARVFRVTLVSAVDWTRVVCSRGRALLHVFSPYSFF